MTKQVVVISLCGCPATGKTTIGKRLIKELSSIATVYYLSFDIVERYINTSSTWRRELWKQSRIEGYQCISSLLYYILNPNQEKQKKWSSWITIEKNSASDLTILIYEKICDEDLPVLFSFHRNCYIDEVGYCILYIHCSKELCIQRNASREIQVPISTIETVFADIEPPDQSIYWEKYSISICTDCDISDSSAVYLLISDASLHPLKRTTIQKEDNTPSYTSFQHRLELELRKRVNEIAKSLDSSKLYIMKQINNEKKAIQSISKSLRDVIYEETVDKAIQATLLQFQEKCNILLTNIT